MENILRLTIYHPVRSRVIFDFAAAVSSALGTWLVLNLFSTGSPHPYILVLYPILFIGLNGLFGLYNELRLSPLWIKVAVLVLSSTVTFYLTGLLGVSPLFMSLVYLFTLMDTIILRATFAFILRDDKRNLIQGINRDHLPVLVVGGGGYIGSHVVDQLLKDGFKVRVFDTFQYGKNVLKDLADNPHLEMFEGDISDIYKLTQALQGVQSVVHLAGIVGDPASAVDPALTRHVNIVSTRLLKETAKAFGVRKFIFASSCSVYGASDNRVDENSKLNPVSLYAQTKIDSERELLQDTHDAFNPVVLRFATVFGHSRKPRFDLVVNLFVAQAFHDGTITLTGKDQWRPFIHVRDVARAIAVVAKAPEPIVSRQVFNVGDDSQNRQIGSIAETVQRIVKVSRKHKTVRIKVTPDISDKRNYLVSFSKIKKTLGFSALISIEDGIGEIYGHMKNRKYKINYRDKYYSNLEAAKELTETFKSVDYQKSHISLLSETGNI